jgi:Mn2+/Fe2+ NRAMP family transporter
MWAILFSIFSTILLQEMTARLGVVGRLGLGEAIRVKFTNYWIRILVSILVVGAILIGNAAYEAGNITGAVLGFEPYRMAIGKLSINPFIPVIGVIAFVILYVGKTKIIEQFLMLLVAAMSIIFLLAAFLLKPDIGLVLKHTFIPSIPANAFIMITGLIGTTVVPYNLFLHASSSKSKWQNAAALAIARWDTVISVIIGGLITMAIMVTSSVAFYETGRPIQNLTDLAIQLNPLLGTGASSFMTFGFLAAGLSSAITAPLAAAYAMSGIANWNDKLTTVRFRSVWIFVLGIGLIFSLLGFKPLNLILFAQVANGLLLPVIVLFLLWVMNDKAILGNYVNTKWANAGGVFVLLVAIGLGAKSILSVFGILGK